MIESFKMKWKDGKQQCEITQLKMEKGLEQAFFPRRCINKRFMKRWSTSLIIREMQIKTIKL